MMKRPHESLATTIALSLALGGGVTPAEAQSSAQHRIVGGFGSGVGGASGSGRALVGESGIGVTAARSSSVSTDLIGGFVGAVYSPRTRVAIVSEGEEFVAIAFPLSSTSRNVSSVLDELGAPDGTKWRLGHWSPPDSTYLEAETGALRTIERGLGYYLITAEPVVVAQEGLNTQILDQRIRLEDGPDGRPAYNQLGNPFHFPVALGDLQVTDGASTVPLLSPENGLTEAVVKVYEAETGSYQANPKVIEPLTAFWVKKVAPGSVSVIVPYAAAGGEEEAPASAKPKGAHWAISVLARQGRRSSEPLVVGAAPVAERSWNSMCQSVGPEPPGGALALSLREESWGRRSGDYVRVFRPAAAATRWDIRARGGEAPGEITLRFDLLDVPAGARVSISDLDRGWSRPVAHGQTITVPSRKEQRFHLAVESAGAHAAEVRFADGFRQVYPQPFRQRSGLVFTAGRPGSVEARIHDVSGRCVRVLRGAFTEPGERVLVWDGADHDGNPVAPGVYLAQYRLGQVRGVARMVKIQ